MIDALGASFAASGLGDLATYEGRFSDAVRILEQGAAAEEASGDPDRAAAKFAALAHTRFLQEQPDAAVDAADAALRNSQGSTFDFWRRESLPRRATSTEPFPSSGAWPQSSKPNLRPTPKSLRATWP